jgi:hypothetical protein
MGGTKTNANGLDADVMTNLQLTALRESLPESRHAKSVEHNFVGDQCEILCMCLRDQHTVKRVSMFPA